MAPLRCWGLSMPPICVFLASRPTCCKWVANCAWATAQRLRRCTYILCTTSTLSDSRTSHLSLTSNDQYSGAQSI
ncbi:hypothetical protein FA95DRAFT_958316 [Auriscalpium vulgare]|uniref:Uncharacterized protein n=1 Tax=Auriscalpium vulgare TaxID=40419 RepID=A0ACB8RXY8_9AGAM|nr:hypothetical protein FA95DRAFT_958316 [Auriscalpium vulgare]